MSEDNTPVDGRREFRLEAMERRTVLVVGDVMLDRTLAGRARRLSPEAPVPVLAVEEELSGLGGAANVAHNLASLGASVRLAGVIGRDDGGQRILDLCRAASIETDSLVVSGQRKTTVKTRFVAQTQQVLRVDSETVAPLPYDEEVELTGRFAGSALDAVIVSDYAKGVVTNGVIAAAIRLARRVSAPCVVDPKGARYERYAGCTVITPNAGEAAAASGCPVDNDEDSARAGKILLDTVGCEAVVITRGSQGLSLVTAGGAWHLGAHTREVFDVAGAGDTFAAALSLALAGGSPPRTAVDIANVAAGLVVQARGVAVTTWDEIVMELGARDGAPSIPDRREPIAA